MLFGYVFPCPTVYHIIYKTLSEELEPQGGWISIIHPKDRTSAQGHWDTLQTGKPDERQLRIVTRNGETRWLHFHGSPVIDPTTNRVTRIYGAAQEVTEQVKAYQLLEHRVDERTRELTSLLKVSHTVASTLELGPLLNLILDELKQMVDYTGAAILRLEDDQLAFLEYRGPMPHEQVMSLRLSASQAEGYHQVITLREPMIIPDVWGETSTARNFQQSMQRLETTFGYMHAWMGVPLIVKDRLIGILRLDHREPQHFTPQHAKLAFAIANEAAVAIENARLYERAQQVAALEERQRLARELHDSVSQALYAIKLGSQTARELLDQNPSQLAEPLAYVHDLAEAGLAEMRALIFELRPESLATEGLIAGLNKQVTSMRARHRIHVAASFCDEPAIPFGMKEALYRIAQKALHNIVKHAQASAVVLSLMCDRDAIVLQVSDNGVGFDPDLDFPGHLGLRSMGERAMRLGGRLEIESEPGKGTCIRAKIPVAGD